MWDEDVEPIRVATFCGSTQAASVNRRLIAAVRGLAGPGFNFEAYEGMAALPHFDPDLDGGNPPPEVDGLREVIARADAVLISTPEYALGVPGTLKNALDWTVSSMRFSGKPVGLVTAATAGFRAHASLLGTLLVIEARMTSKTQLLVSGARAKVRDDEVVHNETRAGLVALVDELAAMVRSPEQPRDYLEAPPMVP
ncbi:MAG: NADPH-dependent FMN reductase [Janthinobacterium lividum]